MATARRSFTTCTMSLVIGLLCLSSGSAQVNPESIAGLWLLDEGSAPSPATAPAMATMPISKETPRG